MTDYIAVEYNASTNETTEREMTEEEIVELAKVQKEIKAQEAQTKKKAAARASALAKLADLGLTAEEIAAL